MLSFEASTFQCIYLSLAIIWMEKAMFNELLRIICKKIIALFLQKKMFLHRKDGIAWNFKYFSILMSHKYIDFVIATLLHAYNAYPLNILTEFYWNLWFLKSISNMQLRNMRKVLHRQNISLYSHSRHAKSYIFRQIQLNLKDHLWS